MTKRTDFNKLIQSWNVRNAKFGEAYRDVLLDGISEKQLVKLSDMLRRSKNVEVLRLCNVEISKKAATALTTALRRNPALAHLSLEDSPDTERCLLEHLAVALVYNRRVQSLTLRGCWSQTSVSAYSIGAMLNSANHLTELHFCHNRIQQNAAATMAVALGKNTSLRLLDLTGNAMDCATIQEITRGLLHNRTLQTLILDFNAFRQDGVAAIVRVLTHNPVLKELSLFGNNVSHVGAELIAQALHVNTSLESLILSFNQIGDIGASAFARALTINTTLIKLWFPGNYIGFKGMQAFAEHLPHMKGLEQLNFGQVFDDCSTHDLVEAMKHNHSLSVLLMETLLEADELSATESGDLDFYLRLNRSGRRLLKDRNVPLSMWPHLFTKASANKSKAGTPDVLYSLLRQRPGVFDPTCR